MAIRVGAWSSTISIRRDFPGGVMESFGIDTAEKNILGASEKI
jgi:hypothetical protein